VFIAELLLTMPVFMIFLLAVVQFGILFGNLQSLALASRVGAEAASEINLTTGVPASVEDAVTKQLTASGISSYCRIRLEHNVVNQANPQAYLLPVTGACDCDPDTILPVADRPSYRYVRLTVCVQLSALMPNLLTVFGLDISDPSRVASSTTIMRNELYGPP